MAKVTKLGPRMSSFKKLSHDVKTAVVSYQICFRKLKISKKLLLEKNKEKDSTYKIILLVQNKGKYYYEFACIGINVH